jgi:hypothetical protein
VSQIVCENGPEEAQKMFEAWLVPENAQEPVPTEIIKIVATQMLDRLFAESGFAPLNCMDISKEVAAAALEAPIDDFEQGYWADVEQIVPPTGLAPDIESLQQNLPDDIRSGLNWATGKEFYFIISALSTPSPPSEFIEELEIEPAISTEPVEENDDDINLLALDPGQTIFPELVEKETAACIKARNSVVAAWLWRRYAADTRLAGNEIRVDPWYGSIAPQTNAET